MRRGRTRPGLSPTGGEARTVARPERGRARTRAGPNGGTAAPPSSSPAPHRRGTRRPAPNGGTAAPPSSSPAPHRRKPHPARRTGAPLHHPHAPQPHIAAARSVLGERQWKSRRATPKSGSDLVLLGSPNGIRTRASTLRGWCPRPLDDGAMLHSALLPSYVFTGRGPVVGEQGIEP